MHNYFFASKQLQQCIFSASSALIILKGPLNYPNIFLNISSRHAHQVENAITMNDAKCGNAMRNSCTTNSKNNPTCLSGHFRHTKVNRNDSKAQKRGFGDVNWGRALLIGRRELRLPVRHTLVSRVWLLFACVCLSRDIPRSTLWDSGTGKRPARGAGERETSKNRILVIKRV